MSAPFWLPQNIEMVGIDANYISAEFIRVMCELGVRKGNYIVHVHISFVNVEIEYTDLVVGDYNDCACTGYMCT